MSVFRMKLHPYVRLHFFFSVILLQSTVDFEVDDKLLDGEVTGWIVGEKIARTVGGVIGLLILNLC